jgi:hydrogenase nickel incorporation protein HypA/HybF
LLEGADVKINHIPGKAQCGICKNTYDTENTDNQCPACGSTKNELLQGQEIRVKSIDIE